MLDTDPLLGTGPKIGPICTTQPYKLIAAAIYPKSTTDQLPLKALARIYAEIMGLTRTSAATSDEEMFRRIDGGNGTQVSLCCTCSDKVAHSADTADLDEGERQHQCSVEVAVKPTP